MDRYRQSEAVDEGETSPLEASKHALFGRQGTGLYI